MDQAASPQAYVTDPLSRVDFSADTKLACSAEEENALAARAAEGSQGAGPSGTPTAPTPASGGTGGAGGYHFVCECFFLTVKVVHLSVISALGEVKNVQRGMQQQQQEAEELAALVNGAAPGSHERLRLEAEHKRAKEVRHPSSFV